MINRVKMHTDFEDFTESGLLKLLAIGVGNPTGCMNVHTNALRYGYGTVIRETAAVMMQKLPVVLLKEPFGLWQIIGVVVICVCVYAANAPGKK